MTHNHSLPPGTRREAGKHPLVHSVRRFFMKGVVAAIGLTALLGAFLLAQQSPQAFASTITSQSVPAKPATNLSFYMTSGSTKIASALGCDQAKTDKRDGQQSHVILDFGAQTRGGTILISPKRFISNGQIERVVEAFSQGYASCIGRTNKVTLGLDIGTNNSGSDVSFAAGQSWARLVRAVRSFNHAHHLSAHVIIFGADDIESWCGTPGIGCKPPSAARAWGRGYHRVGVGNFVNFGSLDGCPPEGGCLGGWTYADYWSVSNRSVAWVVPEIYDPQWATQWKLLDLYSVRRHGSALIFLGPLSTPGFLTPKQSWDDLWRALHDPRHPRLAQKLLFSMEISWEPTRV